MFVKPLRLHEITSTITPDLGSLTELVGEFSGNQTFYCGNLDCKATIKIKNFDKPSFCTKCGALIDWTDMDTKIVKACPTCNMEYENEHNYCKYDGNELFSTRVPKSDLLLR